MGHVAPNPHFEGGRSMSNNPTGSDETQNNSTPKSKKFFTLADVKRAVEVAVHWPSLYPDFEPWVFKFRLALSSEIQKKREEWIALPQAQAIEKKRYREQMLDETCDLLTDYPSGFGDLGVPAADPGSAFRGWVEKITDPEQKETIYKILDAANNSYWAKVMPREFRAPLPNSGS